MLLLLYITELTINHNASLLAVLITFLWELEEISNRRVIKLQLSPKNISYIISSTCTQTECHIISSKCTQTDVVVTSLCQSRRILLTFDTRVLKHRGDFWKNITSNIGKVGASRPSPYHRVGSLDKMLCPTLSISTQAYEWVQGNPAMD